MLMNLFYAVGKWWRCKRGKTKGGAREKTGSTGAT